MGALSMATTDEAAENQNCLESLLYQATSFDPRSRAEAATALAALATTGSMQNEKTELLQRLVEPNKETGETPLLTLIGLSGYSEANLIEVLFHDPRCTEMLWKGPHGIAAWQGILGSFTTEEISIACLSKLSNAIRDICVVLAAFVEAKMAEEIRVQVQYCLDQAGHRSDVVRCNLQEA